LIFASKNFFLFELAVRAGLILKNHAASVGLNPQWKTKLALLNRYSSVWGSARGFMAGI